MGMHLARSIRYPVSQEDFDRKSAVAEKELNGAIIPHLICEEKPIEITFDKERLLKILKRENKIRLDPKLHELYDNNISQFYELDKYCILLALQRCGYNPQDENVLKAYHLATMEYINDPEVRERVVWMKYDKARLGKFTIGQDFNTDNIVLYDTEGNSRPFADMLSKELPNLIVTGSVS
jgi:hypothetical protein